MNYAALGQLRFREGVALTLAQRRAEDEGAAAAMAPGSAQAPGALAPARAVPPVVFLVAGAAAIWWAWRLGR